MKFHDQIAFALRELAGLLKVCPAAPPADVAAAFEHAAKVLGGLASWLDGQATLLRGAPCRSCAGQGHVNGSTCAFCAGTGKDRDLAGEAFDRR